MNQASLHAPDAVVTIDREHGGGALLFKAVEVPVVLVISAHANHAAGEFFQHRLGFRIGLGEVRGETQFGGVVFCDTASGSVQRRDVGKDTDVTALQNHVNLLPRFALVTLHDLESQQEAPVDVSDYGDVHGCEFLTREEK